MDVKVRPWLVALLAVSWLLPSCVITAGTYHTVRKGETLTRIADQYEADLIEIVLINDIEDPSVLREGQLVYIPRVHTKQPSKAAPSPPRTLAKQDRPPPLDPSRLRTAKGKFVWPIRGAITSAFGIRSSARHQGIDISSPEGKPFVAAAPGKVIYSDNKLAGYGNLIIIKHKGDYATVYAHAREMLVRKGELVEQGQTIGRVGHTGRSSGPHLHFEVRLKNVAYDPKKFLPG